MAAGQRLSSRPVGTIGFNDALAGMGHCRRCERGADGRAGLQGQGNSRQKLIGLTNVDPAYMGMQAVVTAIQSGRKSR